MVQRPIFGIHSIFWAPKGSPISLALPFTTSIVFLTGWLCSLPTTVLGRYAMALASLISWYLQCTEVATSPMISLWGLLSCHTITSFPFLSIFSSTLRSPLKLKAHPHQWPFRDSGPPASCQASIVLHDHFMPSKSAMWGRLLYILCQACCQFGVQPHPSWDNFCMLTWRKYFLGDFTSMVLLSYQQLISFSPMDQHCPSKA